MQKFKQIIIHKTFLLFLVLIVLTSILAATTFFRPDLFGKIKVYALDIYSGKLWKEKSTARVFLEEGSLKIVFDIADEDKANLGKYNNKIGVSSAYLEGLAFKIDDNSQKKLNSFLPLHLDLQIMPDEINFQSGIVPGFASSLVTETKEIATESGKLKFAQYSQNEFQLEIVDPSPLLKYATSSGQFVLSEKLLQLYPILERVGTIKMSVNGKSVSGEVRLK